MRLPQLVTTRRKETESRKLIHKHSILLLLTFTCDNAVLLVTELMDNVASFACKSSTFPLHQKYIKEIFNHYSNKPYKKLLTVEIT